MPIHAKVANTPIHLHPFSGVLHASQVTGVISVLSGHTEGHTVSQSVRSPGRLGRCKGDVQAGWDQLSAPAHAHARARPPATGTCVDEMRYSGSPHVQLFYFEVIFNINLR